MRKAPVALGSLATLLAVVGEATATGPAGGLTADITVDLWLFLAVMILPTDALQSYIQRQLKVTHE